MDEGLQQGCINKIPVVNEQGRTSSHGFKLNIIRFNKDISKNLFTRVVNEWNRLGSQMAGVNTKDIFKKWSSGRVR